MTKEERQEVEEILQDDDKRLEFLQQIEQWFGIDTGIDWKDLYSRSMPRVKNDPDGKKYAIYLQFFIKWCNAQALNLVEEKELFCKTVELLKKWEKFHKLPLSGLLVSYEQMCSEG